MEKLTVIHWSDSFPANFPFILSDFCNSISDKCHHQCLHISKAESFVAHKGERLINVVHAVRNLKTVRDAFPYCKTVLFIHGQPDSAFASATLAEIKKSGVDELFVTTPDLLPLFQGKLFPALPIRIAGQVPKDQPHKFVRKSNSVLSFHKWKGQKYELASIKGMAHLPKAILQNGERLYGLAKRKSLQHAKLRRIPMPKSSQFIRNHTKNYGAYIQNLLKSEFIVDTDDWDFTFGSNISITGYEALYCGKALLHGCSKQNLKILSDATGLPFCRLAHQNLNFLDAVDFFSDLAKGNVSLSFNTDVFSAWEPRVDTYRVWSNLAPYFFNDS